MTNEINIDAFAPPAMAKRAEKIGVSKSELSFIKTLLLGFMAGAFIALGAVFATTVTTGASGILSFGVTKLLGGLVFCLGLVLVVVAGAELFTGNNLIAMAWAIGKVSTAKLLRNWGIVYLGNFIGSIFIAIIMLLSKQYTFGGGLIGKMALGIANSKVHLGFVQAIALGIMCNFLVCLAVWLTFSARSTTDRILAVIFPITGFVAAGFEHSVANMYFIPIGLLIKHFDPAYVASAGLELTDLTWGNFFLNNLLPVTIGNIFGGAILVGLIYWKIYLPKSDSA